MKPQITRIKQLIKKTVYSVVPPPLPPASFSQAGEDAVMRFLFTGRKMQTISYLDIGTNVPEYCNNTYLFYRTGSRGVCVEADRTLIPGIRASRPRDKVLNVGVAAGAETVAEFYIFDQTGLNTFDKEAAQRVLALGTQKIVDRVQVPLVNINTLIAENFDRAPDLLSIDIEGWDLPVLRTLDFERFPVSVICAETCLYSETHVRPKNAAIAEFMLSKGYEVYADTYINTIFVNKNWFYPRS